MSKWMRPNPTVGVPKLKSKRALGLGSLIYLDTAGTDGADRHGVGAGKPKDKPYTKADDRGLYVGVFSTDGVVWCFRYRLGGRHERLTLGYLALTPKNARIKRDEAAQAAVGSVRISVCEAVC